VETLQKPENASLVFSTFPFN